MPQEPVHHDCRLRLTHLCTSHLPLFNLLQLTRTDRYHRRDFYTNLVDSFNYSQLHILRLSTSPDLIFLCRQNHGVLFDTVSLP